MKPAVLLPAGIVALLLAASGGYWLGERRAASPEPAAGASQPASAGAAKKERKLLFYRNPMGLPDTSPVPKKDQMGMDYIPVYEGEDDAGSSGDDASSGQQIRISTEKVQKLGVRTELAKTSVLDKVVRAAGRVEPDERRIYAISPKFEGYVERLHVNVTGQPVSRGQALFEVYSPELASAQREYAIAAQGLESLRDAGGQALEGMRQLADSSLLRLRNWDVSDEQIKALARSGEARRSLTFRSPVSGIVTEKKAVQGMRFMPGEALYQVVDLSTVWVVAEVFEQDIALVRKGARAAVTINAYPDKVFEGTVTYVYPTMKADTRTVPVRVELANPGQLLKPAMFAQVELAAGAQSPAIVVPVSAVIDSGTRRIVLVQVREGHFEPREVRLGQRSDQYVAVLDGVREGEAVVVAANFLIDAESNLKAAIGGFGSAKAANAENADGARSANKATVGHRATGRIDGIDAASGTLTLTHDPVASLNWPGMTMDFTLANSALLAGLKPGLAVEFEFVERKPGEWVVTRIQPAPAGRSGQIGPSGPSNPASSARNAHAGH